MAGSLAASGATMRKTLAALALATAFLVGTAGAAIADPGPGNSNQCAPGQHDGHHGAEGHEKPGACDNK